MAPLWSVVSKGADTRSFVEGITDLLKIDNLMVIVVPSPSITSPMDRRAYQTEAPIFRKLYGMPLPGHEDVPPRVTSLLRRLEDQQSKDRSQLESSRNEARNKLEQSIVSEANRMEDDRVIISKSHASVHEVYNNLYFKKLAAAAEPVPYV